MSRSTFPCVCLHSFYEFRNTFVRIKNLKYLFKEDVIPAFIIFVNVHNINGMTVILCYSEFKLYRLG